MFDNKVVWQINNPLWMFTAIVKRHSSAWNKEFPSALQTWNISCSGIGQGHSLNRILSENAKFPNGVILASGSEVTLADLDNFYVAINITFCTPRKHTIFTNYSCKILCPLCRSQCMKVCCWLRNIERLLTSRVGRDCDERQQYLLGLPNTMSLSMPKRHPMAFRIQCTVLSAGVHVL